MDGQWRCNTTLLLTLLPVRVFFLVTGAWAGQSAHGEQSSEGQQPHPVDAEQRGHGGPPSPPGRLQERRAQKRKMPLHRNSGLCLFVVRHPVFAEHFRSFMLNFVLFAAHSWSSTVNRSNYATKGNVNIDFTVREVKVRKYMKMLSHDLWSKSPVCVWSVVGWWARGHARSRRPI